MSYRYRPLLRSAPNNAGLVQLSGALGTGISRAGQQIVNLGNTWDKQGTRDAAIAAANKEKLAKQEAQRALNYAQNPDMVKKINDQYGIKGDLANDPSAPTLANADLGRVDLGAPKEKKGFTLKEGESYYNADGKQIISLPKEKKPQKVTQKVGEDGYYYNVQPDGTFIKTSIKAPEYWKSSSNKGKGDIPAGYKFAGEFNIDDDLDYDLAVAGAYMTDKKGNRYVNVEKYNRFKKLGNTEIK